MITTTFCWFGVRQTLPITLFSRASIAVDRKRVMKRERDLSANDTTDSQAKSNAADTSKGCQLIRTGRYIKIQLYGVDPGNVPVFVAFHQGIRNNLPSNCYLVVPSEIQGVVFSMKVNKGYEKLTGIYQDKRPGIEVELKLDPQGKYSKEVDLVFVMWKRMGDREYPILKATIPLSLRCTKCDKDRVQGYFVPISGSSLPNGEKLPTTSTTVTNSQESISGIESPSSKKSKANPEETESLESISPIPTEIQPFLMPEENFNEKSYTHFPDQTTSATSFLQDQNIQIMPTAEPPLQFQLQQPPPLNGYTISFESPGLQNSVMPATAAQQAVLRYLANLQEAVQRSLTCFNIQEEMLSSLPVLTSVPNPGEFSDQ